VDYPELAKPLHHGSDTRVERIDPARFKRFKDFGLGYYTTTDYAQAEKFARLTARKNKTSSMFAVSYEFEYSPALLVKRFGTPAEEWLDYVVGNRDIENPVDALTYDIIIGPVADDDVGTVVGNYLSGVYGKVGSTGARRIAINFLETMNYRNQVVFKTAASWGCLKFKGAKQIV
jgi:hypothetical protein